MKSLPCLIASAAICVSACAEDYVNFIRQEQQSNGVVWDMPVASAGDAMSALALERGGALFQLWTIEQTNPKDYLLDQKLVGAYLPAADITITTLDPDGSVPRTRVDQPFTVDINVTGLLTGRDFPLAASSVLLERHLASYQDGKTSLEPSSVISGTPHTGSYIQSNGQTKLRFSASILTATDPTKASGEEHFVIHALSDEDASQTQIASGFVQVWPVASGQIKGINDGDELRFETPPLELLLHDLYPRSDTSLQLFKGRQINGVEGDRVKSFPMDRDTSESHVIPVDELDAKIEEDGTYTLALMSDTVYGRELLCDPVTFTVNRTLRVNAMQVGFTDDSAR